MIWIKPSSDLSRIQDLRLLQSRLLAVRSVPWNNSPTFGTSLEQNPEFEKVFFSPFQKQR